MCFLSACCHPNGPVQLVPTVPVIALMALCTVEFSLDQLQNLVGHVHAWSQRAARLVYFECKHYANSPGSWTAFWRKSVSGTHCFPAVLKSGHRLIHCLLTDWHEHLDLWAIFQLNLMGHKDSREARLLWTHGLLNLKLLAYITVTAYSY